MQGMGKIIEMKDFELPRALARGKGDPQKTRGFNFRKGKIMKKFNDILFFVLLLGLTTNLISQTANRVLPDTIQIASEPDYPPYCFVDENGAAAGFSIDLFKAAAKAAGLQLNIKIGVWNKIKKDLAEGRIDALPLVGRTPEREKLYDFTMPYLSLHGAVFVRKGTKDIHSLADLKNKSIVVMKGDNAEEFVRRKNISDEIETTKTFEEAFIALAKGHHDAVITQRVMGIELLNKMDIRNVVPLDFHLPEFRQDFCFAVQKGNTQLFSRLNEGLSIIIANDTFEKIRHKWFGPTLKEKTAFKDILNYLLFILIPLIILFFVVAVILLRKEVKRQTKELKKEIIQRKNAQEALDQNHARLMAIFDGIDQPIYISDPKTYELIYVNRTVTEIFGEIGEQKCYQYFQHRKAPCPFCTNDKILGEYLGKSYRWEFQNEVDHHWYRCIDKAIKWPDGRTVRYEMALDITERKKAEDELVQLKNQLEKTVEERTAELEEKVQKLDKSEKAMLYLVEDLNDLTAQLEEERRKLLISNQELEAFTYSVSHDLRAPLRAIDGYSKFLLEDYAGKLDEDGKRFIAVIRKNATKMDRLILDLLSLSRVSRTDMNLIQVDMGEIAASMFSEIASEEEQKVFQLTIKKTPPVFCDMALIKQVWQNLISNAIKYSSKSEIKEIEIKATRKAQEVIFCISDHGAGFDKKYVDKLFGVFQRLHSEEEFPGTGVGLAIVKRIIQRHGGRVWAEGNVNQGAKFYFSLPPSGKSQKAEIGS